MKHVQKNINNQINRCNDMRYKKKHNLFFLKYRFVEKFVNAVQFHEKILTKTIF
jgi:hypothetical protein